MSAAARHARIGPNAVIRLAEALDAVENKAVTVRLFTAAGLGRYLGQPPQSMVAEEEVTALHRQLRTTLGQGRAASISWIAGFRTAEYLLAHRIPKAAQRLLRLLPRRLAARLLLTAISSHAWTFAGSARFSWAMGRPITLRFEDCPLCREDQVSAPCCSYYAATFEKLFRELISSDTSVRETACKASGGDFCRFEIRF